MLVNILSTEIKERAIILTVKTVGFLARMGYKGLKNPFTPTINIHYILYSSQYLNTKIGLPSLTILLLPT